MHSPFEGEVVPFKTPKAERPKVVGPTIIDAPTASLVRVEFETGDNCREFPNAEAMREFYEQLDRAIAQDCNRFAEHLVRAEIVLKSGLMPRLDKMQALLSQRGRNHELAKKLKLPKWSEYLAKVAREIKVNIRTLQRNLKYFREPKQRVPKDKPKPVVLTKKQQRRILEAVLIANEAVNAAEHNGDVFTPLQEYKKVALDSEEIGSLLESTAPDPVIALGIDLARAVLANRDAKRIAKRFLEAAGVSLAKGRFI
jgi:hypothetical protein